MQSNHSSGDRDDIRVYGVPRPVSELIGNIARNMGISKTNFLRIEIGKIARSYENENPQVFNSPLEMSGKSEYIKITNVDSAVKEAIGNIARNVGATTTSEFLKAELGRIVMSYPEGMRKDF